MRKCVFYLTGLTVGILFVVFAPSANIYADDTAYSDDVQLLQMRADLMAEDVNDSINEEIKQTEKLKRNRYMEEYHTEPEVNLFSNEELAAFEQQRQEKLKKVQAQIDGQVQELQKKTSAQVQNQSQKLTMMPKSPIRGMVAGIVVYQKKGAALVDGRIVRDNSTIKDIKIVSVKQDYVEFEKNGRTWKQGVGEFPLAEFWAEPAATPVQKTDSNQPKGNQKQSAEPKKSNEKQASSNSTIKPVGQKTKPKK